MTETPIKSTVILMQIMEIVIFALFICKDFDNLFLLTPERRRKGRLLERWERRTRRLLFAGQRDAVVGLVKISMLIVSFHFTYMKPLSVCNDQSIHLHMLHQAPRRGELALADIACQN